MREILSFFKKLRKILEKRGRGNHKVIQNNDLERLWEEENEKGCNFLSQPFLGNLLAAYSKARESF